MKKSSRRPKDKEKGYAKENVKKLLDLSSTEYSKDKELANRYVDVARKTAKKYQVGIEKEQKKLFCKHCYKALKAGENLNVRTSRKKRVVYYCKECKKYTRFPYIKEKKEKKT